MLILHTEAAIIIQMLTTKTQWAFSQTKQCVVCIHFGQFQIFPKLLHEFQAAVLFHFLFPSSIAIHL